MFKFKLGYVEEQLSVAFSKNSDKTGSFMKDDFYKVVKSCITGMSLRVLGQRSYIKI